MKAIEITFDVLKEDKFNEIKDLHSLNMLLIYVTCDVSKLSKFIEIKEWHS
jgi:hypothetical protein